VVQAADEEERVYIGGDDLFIGYRSSGTPGKPGAAREDDVYVCLVGLGLPATGDPVSDRRHFSGIGYAMEKSAAATGPKAPVLADERIETTIFDGNACGEQAGQSVWLEVLFEEDTPAERF